MNTDSTSTCVRCGRSASPTRQLAAVTDGVACEVWCGEPPAPVRTPEWLAAARADALTRLEKDLVAEVELLRALVRRAERDHRDEVVRIPEWVRDTAHIRVDLTDGRVLNAGGGDWFEWWHAGTTQEAIDALAGPSCTAEYGGPGYTACTLPAGHDGHHTAPLGTMRTARWATGLDAAEAPA